MQKPQRATEKYAKNAKHFYCFLSAALGVYSFAISAVKKNYNVHGVVDLNC
jgi:hypothetical protein